MIRQQRHLALVVVAVVVKEEGEEDTAAMLAWAQCGIPAALVRQ